MEFFKKKEVVNPDDARVSEEELAALGIPKGVRMTRGDLNNHLETLRRKSAYGETIVAPVGEEDSDQERAAGQKRQEMDK